MTDTLFRPLIGITASTILHFGRPYNRFYLANHLAVERAGGLPVAIPAGLREDTLRALYERLDGVLLPGGSDVDPAIYGQQPHPTTYGIDEARDQAELTLARWTVADDRPLFGICRGHQVINVALGGSLVQDIPSQVTTTLRHDQPDEEPRTNRLHEVSIDPTSRLAHILGATRLTVNSLHHQSVAQPAPGAHISAHAPDGIIEALELPDKRFALSVQWHPEDLAPDDTVMAALFESFVAAAREHAFSRMQAAR